MVRHGIKKHYSMSKYHFFTGCYIMIYFRSFCFFIWFGVYLTLIDVAITNADVVNLQTLSSTAGASTGLEKNMSIHAVQKRDLLAHNICYSDACIDTALKIEKNINKHLDPCEDFYKFSCDHFAKSLPYFIRNVDVNTIQSNSRMEQLRTIIEKDSPPNEPRSHRLARDFYKACMKKNVSEEHGIVLLYHNIKELGDWPVLAGDTWNESDFHWINSIVNFRKIGFSINYFINFNVIYYPSTNDLTHKLYLAPPTFGFPRNELIKGLDDKKVQEYYKYMVDMAVFLGAERDRAVSELYESLQFEIELAKISYENEKMLPEYSKYNEITVGDLQRYYESSVDWLQELNIILAPQAELTEDDIVIESVAFYLSDMGELISKTPKRVQANYAFWRVVDDSADYIDEPDFLRKRKLQFYEKLTPKKEPKWKECVQLVSSNFDFSITSMELSDDAKKTIVEMTSYTKRAFKKILEGVKWMNDKIRKRALTKLHNLRSFISYPDKYMDITRLDKFYKNLELNPDNPFGNKLNMTIFETNRMFEMLNEEPWSIEWWRSYLEPMKLTATNKLNKNTILIPAGHLQEPFFNISRPNYMNYGSIGSTIGHEITHAFTAKGKYFYKKGNVMQWWDSSTIKHYTREQECLIQHYEKYRNIDVGMNFDEIKTLNEDSADFGGTKAAYYAYQKWVQHNGEEDALPGLCYTPNQLFWISYAHSWCGKYSRKAIKKWITDDEKIHSPSEYRVNAVLSNIEEFSQDFNCKIGSRMNPLRKCNMW